MTWLKYLAVLPLAVGLVQCDQVENIRKPKPKPGPYAFDLVLRTSPRAEAALKTTENLHIDALYYGHAKPAYSAEADRLHRIVLGRENWLYPSSNRKLHLYGSPLDASKLSRTIEGEPQVMVTVDGNDVTCHTYIGAIRDAQRLPPVLSCELTSETYWADLAREGAGVSR